MFDMDAEHMEYIGLALFVASELIAMSRLRSNSVLELLLSAAMRAFPYELRRRSAPTPMLTYQPQQQAPTKRRSSGTRRRARSTKDVE